MATAPSATTLEDRTTQRVPPLYNGDRLRQPEFHRRYSEYPEDVKYELINGIVFTASPVGRTHGTRHSLVNAILAHYAAATPGLEVADNTTVILGPDSEPQPDLLLRILPEWGGRTKNTKDGYIEGPPELVVEVSHSSVAIDLHAKKDDYRQAGVGEYLVVCTAEQAVHWFDFSADRPLPADAEGVVRSVVFPGLWLDAPAMLRGNLGRLIAVLQQGLATAEYAAFASRPRSGATSE